MRWFTVVPMLKIKTISIIRISLRLGIQMNQIELKKVMNEIESIINQLAECNYCKQGIDQKSKRLLSELFKLKIEQACQIKKAS